MKITGLYFAPYFPRFFVTNKGLKIGDIILPLMMLFCAFVINFRR